MVDGSDLVDPDAQDLLDPLSSWEGQKPYVPPGMQVPCAPDRWKHEAPSGPGELEGLVSMVIKDGWQIPTGNWGIFQLAMFEDTGGCF